MPHAVGAAAELMSDARTHPRDHELELERSIEETLHRITTRGTKAEADFFRTEDDDSDGDDERMKGRGGAGEAGDFDWKLIPSGGDKTTSRYLLGHSSAPDAAVWDPFGARIASCSRASDQVIIHSALDTGKLQTISVPEPVDLRWGGSGARLLIRTADSRILMLVESTAHQGVTKSAFVVASLWLPRAAEITSFDASSSGVHVIAGDGLGEVDILRHDAGTTLEGTEGMVKDVDVNAEAAHAIGRPTSSANAQRLGLPSATAAVPLADRPGISLPIIIARREYFMEKRIFAPRVGAHCARCGYYFAVTSAALAAASTMQRAAARFGWEAITTDNPRLLQRCTRCRKLHRMSPILSTVAGLEYPV